MAVVGITAGAMEITSTATGIAARLRVAAIGDRLPAAGMVAMTITGRPVAGKAAIAPAAGRVDVPVAIAPGVGKVAVPAATGLAVGRASVRRKTGVPEAVTVRRRPAAGTAVTVLPAATPMRTLPGSVCGTIMARVTIAAAIAIGKR